MLVFVLLLLRAAPAEAEAVSDSYVAAVYEHAVILNPEPRVPLSRRGALQHMLRNLDVYEEQAARAARQGAQILVFPEDGVYGFNFTRSSVLSYLETVPDPERESWNPCAEPDRHNNTEVLRRLSCMARRHGLYLVANVGDVQPCPPSPSSTCPPDGRWQFNTDVVFSSDGLLVARYHKYNLYFEDAFDSPPKPEVVTFDTPFAGRFGLIICFDILFRDPTVTLVEKGVRQLVFPTAWMNQLPLLDAVQFQGAFSLGANVTLLAANIRNDSLNMKGSGVYTPFSATYRHALPGEPEEGRLLVARVPVLDPRWAGRRPSEERDALGENESGHCHQRSCADPPSPPVFTSSMMYDSFKFALLDGSEGGLTVCDGAFCCRLQYRWLTRSQTELYALGAFSGTHVVNGRYALQVCAVVRCAGTQPGSCGQEVDAAESRLDFLLEATFQTPYVYPMVLGSRLVLEQPETVERSRDGTVSMKHSSLSAGLVTASLYGRVYNLDDG